MKNRKLNITLVVLIIIIYTAVIYRVVKISKTPAEPARALISSTSDDQVLQPSDTIKLLYNYPDPFLKNRTISKKTEPANIPIRQTISRRQQNIARPVNRWPDIIYGGRVEKSGSENYYAILSVGGKKYIVTKGSPADQVLVHDIYKDSVRVLFMDEYKTITKNTE